MCDNELIGTVHTHYHDDLAQQWLKKHENRMMEVKDLRKYWAHHVPRIFAPKNNCDCLNISFDEVIMRNDLIVPLERFITNVNSPESIFNKLKQCDDPPMLCGRVFKSGEPTYSCRDCGLDPTCVICVDCFRHSEHRNHRYKMSMSGGGGYCDCGDREAWKSNVYCDTHVQGVLSESVDTLEPLQRVPSEFDSVIDRTRLVMRAVLYYCFEILTWDNNLHLPNDLSYKSDTSDADSDTYATMLFNDEVHTYEQVITTLNRAIDCTQKEAIDYATTIDREGRSIVKCAQFTACSHVKSLIERITSRHGSKPLRVDVMHTDIIAHQTFSMRLLIWLQEILGYCEAFRSIFAEILMTKENTDSDGIVKSEGSYQSPLPLLERIMKADTQLWKSMRNQWHQLFITGLLMESKSKKEFAKIFTRNYGTLMKDFIADDHEHAVSITSLSVQLFTVPTLAQSLIAEDNAIVVLLKTFISECGRHRNHDGKLAFERNHNALQPFKRSQYILFDLKYLLAVKPVEWSESLRKNFLHGVTSLVELLVWMQGMDVVLRQVGQHVEFEAEWETGINLQLKLAPLISLVIEWCSADRITLIKALRQTLKELTDLMGKISVGEWELCGYRANCIDYEVSSMPVTIHLPLSRLAAGLILQLGKYDLNYLDPNFMVGKKPLPFQLMELPLRTQVMIAQFRAGMWRRNGYSLVNQIYFYHNSRLRDEMYDRDILMLQIGAARIDPNEYLIHILNKFGLLFWAQENYEGVTRKPEEDFVRQTISLVEEFLGLILTVVSERFVPGIGTVTVEDKIKREIIQWLSMEPMTHSELVKCLPKETQSYDFSIEDLINEVAAFKRPANSTATGKYELKSDYYGSFNPFFYHYTRQDQSTAEEAHIKRKRLNHEELICCPPPVPPDFAPQFVTITALFTSDIMIHILYVVLKRTCNLHASSFSETQFEKVLHLIGVSLHEEMKGTFSDVMFTEKCINKGIYALLEECTKCSRVDIHKDLLRWVIRKFNEIVQLKQGNPMQLLTDVVSDDDPMQPQRKKDHSDRKRNSDIAAARRARIMAQMTAMQKNFIKEHAEFFKETEEGVSCGDGFMMELPDDLDDIDPIAIGPNQRGKSFNSEVHTCILCREEQEVTMGSRCMVLSAFVQRSTVLSKNRDKKLTTEGEIDPLFVTSDLYIGPHISTCGHVMHSDCWQKFFENVLAKERRRPIRYGRHVSFDVDKSEFLCPLCECLSNCVTPIIPALNVENTAENRMIESKISISNWLSAMHAAVEKVQPVWLKDPTMTDNEEKYICRLMPQPLPEVLKSLPDDVAQEFEKLFTKYQSNTISCEQLSTSLTDIMKLFSQSIYTIFLGVNPNTEDDRVSLISYWSCAYTVHAIERMLRVENKPIFGDLSSRKYNCLQALVRYIGSSSAVFNDTVLSSHCIRTLRFLLINDHYLSNPMCCLDIDAFFTLVTLIITTPCLYANESDGDFGTKATVPNGNAGDRNYVHLMLMLNMVQIILTNDGSNLSEEPMETDSVNTEDNSCLVQFYSDVLISAGIHSPRTSIPNAGQISLMVKSGLLPYLRSAALFFHFLTNVSPPSKLKDNLTQLSPIDEFSILCQYLGLSSKFSSLLQCPSLVQLSLNWTRHPRVNLIYNSTAVVSPLEMPAKRISQPHSVNRLVNLPNDYSELINGVSQFTCPNSEGDDSRSPTMCLVCGAILCSQSYCCQTDLEGTMVGACTNHAHFCGAGVGMFLRIRDCKILLLTGKTKGCYMAPPYIDEYGETDQGLLRGNPLNLCEQSYAELHKLWLRHGIPEQIAHALEMSSNLAATNWGLL